MPFFSLLNFRRVQEEGLKHYKTAFFGSCTVLSVYCFFYQNTLNYQGGDAGWCHPCHWSGVQAIGHFGAAKLMSPCLQTLLLLKTCSD